jgi:hypothetical protein|tara:strand:- start:206 stop:826 length:621 start_codon:yes stop_codon:yes gene_type:complete
MKSVEMLNQIKTLLNIEVKLEEMKLENGTVVSAESFEKDKEIFIVTDDEKVAMPVGEYLLEDGRLVVISEEGVIGDVREVSDEVPAKETEEGEEITSDLEDKEEVAEDPKEEMAYVTKEEFSSAVEEMRAMIDEVKAMMPAKEEEMSEEAANVLKSRTVKEEFSEAAAAPIKHNPEGESVTKKKVEFAKGNFNTTAMERVLNKLNK